MDAPSSADVRYWSQVNFAEFGQGTDPIEGQAPETTLSDEVALPSTDVDVESVADLDNPTGKVWISNGSTVAVVSYAGITGNQLTGCSGGSGTFPAGSRVQQYVDDPLDIHLYRSLQEIARATGITLADVEVAQAPLVAECTQYLVEYRVTSGTQEVAETGADFDMVGAFSAGNFSETRRGDNRRRLVLHPVPKIAKLLEDLMTEDRMAETGFGAPAVSEVEDPADWRVARNIMGSYRWLDPGFGPLQPPWY